MIYEILTDTGRFIGVFESDKPKEEVVKLIKTTFQAAYNDLDLAAQLLQPKEIYLVQTETIFLN